jgi:hypothetical protein
MQQPMMEKLHDLKLQGLLEALERQEQDETARELSFLDRLALLIDQRWNWRQNQALARRVRASRLKGAACVENIVLSITKLRTYVSQECDEERRHKRD